MLSALVSPLSREAYYFFSKNNGLQNQSVLYSSKSLDLEPTVLLDPNKLSKDGTVALKSYEVSPDGKYLAYSTSASGSDWVEWKVREISSRERPLRSPQMVQILGGILGQE
jgi:prolyl oligopeptidase